MNRKKFLSKTCFTGACFCGFAAMPGLANSTKMATQDNTKQLNQDWLSSLLTNLNQHVDEDTLREILKKSSIVHYHNLNMDALLSNYIGDFS